MQIKANGMMKVLLPLLIVVVCFIGVKACGSKQSTGQNTAKTSNVLSELSQDDLKTLGIEGDTSADTLRTLIGALRDVRVRQETLDKQNKELIAENQKLKGENTSVDVQISNAVNAAKQETNEAIEKQKNSLLEKLNDLTGALKSQGQSTAATTGASSGTDIPVGLGLDAEDTQPAPSGQGQMIWISPQDAKQTENSSQNDKDKFSFPTSFLDDNPISRQRAEYDRVVKNKQELGGNGTEVEAEPVYTLPENSTLVGSKAMTALIGRIPINDKVTDPYPFKILIGKDNLTANGIELPDVEGAIVSGTATGDMVLSCVRGTVNSITFVFSDGRIRTLPKPVANTQGNNNDNARDGGSIGWISDNNGIPCISGERKSNASTYLPTIALLGMGSAAGDALTQNQYTTQNNNQGVTSALTGNAGQAVLGQSLGGGFKEVTDWVKQRYGQTFDAVYVPPGANVAIHITRQLAVDYEDNGRKVRYDFSLPGTGGHYGLD
ncbi:TIGR03752 family integrating conjugative element protein [Salmonella enterica]|nr:TIGR03752 family integrating conjugative element protein [Salmonella enterica]ECR4969918.1 TIGR03752 family integrating conjugative element protein [Salmonella enterica]EEF8439371.1 TIGR03752 family integrating conjugative element protein [Salmonella enterica]EFO8729792.1 TIGR03752 family integrating conjugative element protein [Salmonella enterica]EGG5523097.1 TIGR03752 family integrating conjugative element protein [Salmonella enterica]